MSAIVDFHSHFFSRTFFEALATASPRAGTPAEHVATVTSELGIDLPDPSPEAHWRRWESELDRYGVEHMVTFASAPQEVDDVARAVAASNGRATGFAMVDPTAEGAAARTAELLGPKGFKGVLLFPAMHRFDPAGPEVDEVFAVVAGHGAIATVHCGLLQVALRDRFGLPRGYDLTLANPLRLIPAADKYRRARFVIPHFGGGYFREALMTGAQCENVFLDTSSSNAWMRTNPGAINLVEVLERSLSVFGPERILFGTDSSVFPRGWRNDLLTVQREALGALGGNTDLMRSVLGGNASRLLGLSPRASAPARELSEEPAKEPK